MKNFKPAGSCPGVACLAMGETMLPNLTRFIGCSTSGRGDGCGEEIVMATIGCGVLSCCQFGGAPSEGERTRAYQNLGALACDWASTKTPDGLHS
jgi:hypothetical protein